MINKSCRICRRGGRKLFLKGTRCLSSKCSFTKRSYAPGAKSAGQFSKKSDYNIQLREKQNAKAVYGQREKQFKNNYLVASKSKTATGEKLLQRLEMRLDNIVFRLGFAQSRNHASQLVSHGHIYLNGKKVNLPSCQVKNNSKVEIKNTNFKFSDNNLPAWLKVDKKQNSGEIIKIPAKDEIETDLDEQLIVEFYSR